MGSVYLMSDGILNYYGSTTMSLHKRLIDHRRFNNKCSSNKLNRDKLEIVEVEWVEDLTKLKERERYYIENNVCVNKFTPIQTKEERRKYLSDYHADYYIKNKNKLQTTYKCACGRTIQVSNKKHVNSKCHKNYLYFI